jgi:hypothetical protein
MSRRRSTPSSRRRRRDPRRQAPSPTSSASPACSGAGFAVAPEQTMAWLAAIELLGPTEIGDIRRAARATLAPPPERFAEFDALFDAHFLGAISLVVESEPSEDEPLRAAEDSSVGPEPIFSDETRESGAKATERGKAFGAPLRARADERRNAAPVRPRASRPRAAAARLSLAFGARRTWHRCAAYVSRRHAQRRRVRLAASPQAPPAAAPHRGAHRRLRLDEGAHASASRFRSCAGACRRSVEVFTMGTRLTRITRPLRLRNREQALATASLLVADWDGGTRIGDALGAFLAIPRFAALARGAALVVLSDGLERGDPTAMGDAVARLPGSPGGSSGSRRLPPIRASRPAPPASSPRDPISTNLATADRSTASAPTFSIWRVKRHDGRSSTRITTSGGGPICRGSTGRCSRASSALTRRSGATIRSASIYPTSPATA